MTNDSTRRTIRTVVQLVIDAAIVIPVAVVALDLHESAVGAGLIVVGAGVTKLMNTPKVEAFLKRWAPWLAAEELPDQKSTE